MFSREAYVQLLKAFKSGGYAFTSFDSYAPNRCVLLRHDVDFSLADAAALAEIEGELGISATYFVLLSSDFYNAFSESSRTSIHRIVESGANLGLHFDPTAHSDVNLGFASEKAVYEVLTGRSLQFVSLHRPRDFLSDNNRKLPGVRHTYEDEYFKELKYVSDSGGSFSHGHPLESDEFRQGRSIHLNLHPIWWIRDGSTPSDKLRSWQGEHFAHLLGEMSRNCRTFDGRPKALPAA